MTNHMVITITANLLTAVYTRPEQVER